MQLVFNANVVINACERYLEVNNHNKNSTFCEEALDYDSIYAIYETLVRAVVPPTSVVLYDFEYELISNYMSGV